MPADGVAPIVVAAGVGLLIGVERERRKRTGDRHGAAGLRTFVLVALAGGLTARIGAEALVVAGLLVVGGAALVSYARVTDPGLTTETALIVTYLLGVLAQEEQELAAGIAVAVTILLAERSRLQRFATRTLTEEELRDGLLLAAAALILLPIIPDEPLGPGDALNPHKIWRLVVLIMAIGAVAHVALRALGPRRGIPLAGFAGGFVSATATVAAMGARARREPAAASAAVAGAVAASVATVVLDVIVIAVVDTATLAAVAPALALSGLAAAAAAGVCVRRLSSDLRDETTDAGRAFDLKVPLAIALTISVVVAVAHLLQRELGDAGALVALALAGFADAQSSAVSAASLAAAGQIDHDTAALGVILALTTNSVSKVVVALAFARRRDRLPVWGGLAALVIAAWAGLLIST